VRVCDVFTVVSVSMYLFEAWLCCVVVCLLRVCVYVGARLCFFEVRCLKPRWLLHCPE